MTPADRRADEALAWVMRIQDRDFADWESHIAWLEADPAHAEAFDRAALLIEAAADGLDAGPRAAAAAVNAPVNDNAIETGLGRTEQGGRRRWRIGTGIGAALAAGIVAMAALPSLIAGGGRSYAIETAPGERRVIALTDGTRVALNGDSRLLLDRADPRSVTVQRGEAYFVVVHDAAHPFAVQAGDARFQDVGTAFDVVQTQASTEVAVREGAVMFDPQGAAVRLDGGQAIAVTAGGATVRAVDAAGVGLWQRGRLSYNDASLATVARDIARNIGQPVAIDPTLQAKRFSGVIVIEADRSRMFRHLAAIAGVSIRRDGAGWRMASPTR